MVKGKKYTFTAPKGSVIQPGTKNLFKEGLPLCSMLDGLLGAEVELFVRSGQEILRRIELVQYDIFRCRPILSKRTGLKLLIQCFWSKILTA